MHRLGAGRTALRLKLNRDASEIYLRRVRGPPMCGYIRRAKLHLEEARRRMKRRKPDRLLDDERTRRRAHEGNRRARFLDHIAALKEVARRLKDKGRIDRYEVEEIVQALVRLKLEAAEGRSG